MERAINNCSVLVTSKGDCVSGVDAFFRFADEHCGFTEPSNHIIATLREKCGLPLLESPEHSKSILSIRNNLLSNINPLREKISSLLKTLPFQTTCIPVVEGALRRADRALSDPTFSVLQEYAKAGGGSIPPFLHYFNSRFSGVVAQMNMAGLEVGHVRKQCGEDRANDLEEAVRLAETTASVARDLWAAITNGGTSDYVSFSRG